MASINWVILQPNSLNPTPLPHEKILLTTRSVSLSLFPSIPGAPLSQSPDPKKEFKSQGTTHVTNQRVIFVADGAHSASSLASGSASVVGAAGIPTKLELQTLSAPYSHFLDGRYVQPWFAATYYEALVLPASGGGLEGPHIVRLSFKESGGASFFELVQEMKERLGVSGGRSAVVEPLPLYTPSSPTSTSAELPLPLIDDATSSPEEHQIMPPEDDLSAANVANEETERERRENNISRGGEPVDGPPAYEV